MVKGFSDLVLWCPRGPWDAGRQKGVDRVCGQEAWAPHSLLSRKVQSIRFAKVRDTTVKPTKSLLNIVHQARGGEGVITSGTVRGVYKTTHL